MKAKNLTLIVSFLSLIPLFAHAQRSAQATMRVRATVVSAATVESEGGSILSTDQDHSIRGELGSVTLSGADPEAILVSTKANVLLASREGDQLVLPVDLKKEHAADKLRLTFHTRKAPENNVKRGSYTGILTTRIEYM